MRSAWQVDIDCLQQFNNAPDLTVHLLTSEDAEYYLSSGVSLSLRPVHPASTLQRPVSVHHVNNSTNDHLLTSTALEMEALLQDGVPSFDALDFSSRYDEVMAEASKNKLSLPLSVDPPGPANPPRQLVWIVGNTRFYSNSGAVFAEENTCSHATRRR
jgi:hypothetical protein